MRKIVGVGLVVMGVVLGSVCIAAFAPLQSPVGHWLTAVIGLLLYLHIGFDVVVLSSCAIAALVSGILFLTNGMAMVARQETADEGLLAHDSSRTVALGWQPVRFLLHLAAVYWIAASCTPQLAGWTKNALLPFLQLPTRSGNFQFLFSHMLAFSFMPAFLAGLANARFRHKVAQYVWLVPTIVLAYKFLTFPAPEQSVFGGASWFSLHQRQLSSAFQQYFGGGFLIREYQGYSDFWSIWRSNPEDMRRGLGQLRFTGPFYAAAGYCLAACITLRTQLHSKLAKRVKDWEQWKFGGSVE